MELEIPERPVLRDIPDVDLMKVGTWPLSTGEMTFTTEILAAAVRAAQSTAVARPVIKLGHTDPRFDGEPAVGFVDNLRLSEDGSTLVGDLRGLPAWLAEIMPSAYPNRSIEGALDYRDQTGKVHDFALTGLALLGVTPPAVGTLSTLRDVAALYEVNAGRDGPAEGIHIMPSKIINASASVEDVRRSFYESGPGTDSYMWIEELFLEPTEVIAMDDEDATLYRIGFTLSEDGSVSWGEPEAVKREYVAASKNTPVAQWPTATLSRKTTVNAAEGDEEENTTMELTEEQVTALIEVLALDENADAAAIVTAVEDLAKKVAEADPANDDAATAGAAVAARAKSLGMKVVEAGTWDATQNRLRTLESREHERVVDDAVRAGKLMPASRKAALSQLQKGLLSAKDVESLEPVVTLAGREVGHDTEVDNPGEPEDVRETDAYKNWK